MILSTHNRGCTAHDRDLRSWGLRQCTGELSRVDSLGGCRYRVLPSCSSSFCFPRAASNIITIDHRYHKSQLVSYDISMLQYLAIIAITTSIIIITRVDAIVALFPSLCFKAVNVHLIGPVPQVTIRPGKQNLLVRRKYRTSHICISLR